MKKTIIKAVGFLLTFIIALFVLEKVMNKGHDNMTMEMAEADLPVVTMREGNILYNTLFGYSDVMDVTFQRDSVTVLGENREVSFVINPYGREITEVVVEVRSADGERLVENTPIHEYHTENNGMEVSYALKDLLEADTRYSMAVILTLDGEEKVYYYTDVVWSEKLHMTEKLDFIRDFHRRLYDKEAAKELTKYMETNAQLEKNQSFHNVNIHSSFQQLTWGELDVQELASPAITLVDIAEQTGTFLMDYYVTATEGNREVCYRVKEQYRVRYTTDRIYLLDYQRNMTQLVDVDHMFANDKILLGITDENIDLLENADGSVVVFQEGGQLLSYNVNSNKLAILFSFYDKDHMDERTENDAHAMKVMDVDEGGNVLFAVYGYMNRGRHEGEVGVQLYAYSSTMNTIEELVYIPYEKTYAVLRADMERLLYMNRDRHLYMFLENTVLHVDLNERKMEKLVQISSDESLQVSDDHKIIVWQEGNSIYHSRQLNIMDLDSNSCRTVQSEANEAIIPLGFMGEDIIYGVARESDIVEETSGSFLFPMYKICICSVYGAQLKEYQQTGIYVTDCTIVDNQITLHRLKKTDSDGFEQTFDDQITNNAEEQSAKNNIVVANIDRFEHYVQIQTRSSIDTKNVKVLTPKEIVFEGGRTLELPAAEELAGQGRTRYYVYGPCGVDGIFNSAAVAVNKAYEISGSVVDDKGNYVWRKGNRVTKNQIMAITENSVEEGRGSLAVCLDTMLRFEGITKNSAQLLQMGQTVTLILQNNLDDDEVLDLRGCPLDALLYYVNQDIPVLAMLNNGEAVLVTGFNEYNVVIMDPVTGTLYKKGINDSAEWFAENGNQFVTYMRK